MIRDRFSGLRAHMSALGVYGILLAATFPLLPAQAYADGTNLAFDFKITLSPKAAAKLKSSHETITVWASFYGEPTHEGENHTDELGMVDLGKESFELPGQPGVVHITGKNAGGAKLKWVKGPPSVNVNLYTSRKSSDQNLIDCDLIDGKVAKVQAKPITVNCFLIGEPIESKSFP
ncbi:hypothetical protein [Aquamicrobium defluvii]|uniref:Uncharacterized protein n=1 Tax=Aquamicrobium defluvii TaxID=69279 RepID=A0A011TIC2_9HYPH|nr:hypothetical protein [Aquamicrobium defluvii]EXL03737.1 hypothetical protein BG36_11535 [Aquamicrobium defluvii]EZQ15290.1 hypothetical protein CF98_12665 [Halopseudomonas bauzanensis]